MWSSTWAWGPHVHVEVDGIAIGVGVVPPVAEPRRGEQALLSAGMQGLAAHDQPGAFGPAAEIDQVGELRDGRAGPLVAVLAQRWARDVVVASDVADGPMDGGVGAGHHGEAGAAGPGVPHEVGASR